MTLCLAAKFKGGTLYATDSALTSGGARTKMIEGKWFKTDDYVALYSGSLWYAQELQYRDGALRERMKELYSENKDDSDSEDDSANILSIDSSDGSIIFWEYTGAYVACGDFGGCGSGSDVGLALLRLIYQPNRSEKWLRQWFARIFEIVAEGDGSVATPVHFGVIYA